ncbi:MAG: SCP2 sterol-binding domain-containing protein [Chloroflexota bacterium]
MGIQFATDEWAKALMNEINASEAYKKAAANWEGDFYFITTKGKEIAEDTYLYLDLWHGEARDAYLVEDPGAKKVAFELSAPLDVWRKVLEKKVDPIRGIMSGQLKLKGNMMTIMKTPKAATELVASAMKVDTDWP